LMAMDDKDIESKVYISLNKEHNFIVIEREWLWRVNIQ
jgi:hypothetical protein